MNLRASAIVVIVGLTLLGSIAACANQSVDGAKLARDPEVQCPSIEFQPFLKAFVNNVDVQRAFTSDPYEATIYDPADLEADPKVSKLVLSEIEFPLMLSESEMDRHGAEMSVAQKAQDWFQVSTNSVGTGAYSMTFNFRLMDGCWRLTDSTDAST